MKYGITMITLIESMEILQSMHVDRPQPLVIGMNGMDVVDPQETHIALQQQDAFLEAGSFIIIIIILL